MQLCFCIAGNGFHDVCCPALQRVPLQGPLRGWSLFYRDLLPQWAWALAGRSRNTENERCNIRSYKGYANSDQVGRQARPTIVRFLGVPYRARPREGLPS